MQETISLWDNGLCLTSKSIVPERLMASTRIILSLRRPVQRRIARLAQRTQHKTVFRRCQILLALGRRQTPEAIAVALNCHVSTVYRTRQAFLADGEESLPVRKSPGRPCKVTLADEQQLTAALQQEPRTVGKNFSNWTAQKLKVHLRWTVHPVTVWRHMRRQRWRWHRPVPRVASPDRRYRAKARYLRRLRTQARRGEIHLYYADEMDVALLPTISGRWMRQGQQTQVNTPGQNAKQYVFGAVNYVTGALVWLTWSNKNNVGFRYLLQQVVAQHQQTPVKIVIILDNFRIHKAKAVLTWLRVHRAQLRLYFLPTYSPRLNPIERVWRHFRRNVTDNYYFGTLARLMAAVKAFLTELASSPSVILSIIA
jgi:transposase